MNSETFEIKDLGLDEPSPWTGFIALELLAELLRNAKTLLIAGGVGALLATVIVLLMPNIYTGRTRLLPPQQSQSVANMMLGQLGPLAGMVGKDLNVKNTNETYVAILKSRTVADGLVEQFHLETRYNVSSRLRAIERLEKNSRITLNRDNTIDVEVEDRDPSVAAQIANGYVDGLVRLSRTLAVTEASRRRVFFEAQLRSVRDELALAESELKKAQERSGLIEPNSQARSIIIAVADLRAQIAAREVQLSAMKIFATANNPDYMRIQQEINGLQQQLSKLQQDKNTGGGDTQIATKNVPEVGLEFMRRLRDVKYNESLFEALAKQFEIAKIDEAKDAAVIQVLDLAIPPERKTSPQRTLIVLVVTFLTVFSAALYVLGRCLLLRAPGSENRLAKIKMLRAAFRAGFIGRSA
jgi:tyrosine-protein kinase Etk/Wzc